MPKSLDGLHPYVKEKAEQLLVNANKRLKNYKMIIVQAYRSKEEQDKLYAQGRTTKGDIVTNAKGGQSLHNFGLAIDFALVDSTGKKVSWDTKADFDKDGLADWTEVVLEAKKLGFEWGGDWKTFKDCPHFQMTGGLTDKEIIAGKKPVFKTETPKPVAPAKPKPKYLGVATVSSDKLNVRSEADADSKVVKVVSKGQHFNVIKVDGNWLKIGEGQWISKKYVTYHIN